MRKSISAHIFVNSQLMSNEDQNDHWLFLHISPITLITSEYASFYNLYRAACRSGHQAVLVS